MLLASIFFAWKKHLVYVSLSFQSKLKQRRNFQWTVWMTTFGEGNTQIAKIT